MVEVTPIVPQKRKLRNNRFGELGSRHRRWQADLEENETLEDALQGFFWADIADRLMGHDQNAPRALGDIIEIYKADTGLYAEVIVREIGKGYVKVELKQQQAPAPVEIPAGALTTKWNVGKKCHDVIRSDNKQVLSTGHQTKDAAAKWIVEHLKAVAA